VTESEDKTTDEQAPEAAEETAPEADAPEEQAPAEAAPAPEADAQPAERVPPKQARKLRRSQHSGEAAPPRSAEERAADRAEVRRRKARHRTAYRAKLRERRSSSPAAVAETPAVESAPGGRAKVRRGIVVSDRADKTITVRIDTARPHRTYGKIVRTSSTIHAHDESNEAGVGDTVRLVETRPLSRTKRWRLVEVLERAR